MLHKVCYKSYLFLKPKPVALAAGFTSVGPQAEYSSDIPQNKTKTLKNATFDTGG